MAAADPCVGLAEDACVANLDCGPMWGQALQRNPMGGSCFDDGWSYLGCRALPDDCPHGEAFACDGTGAAFRLRDRCLPLGDDLHTCGDALAATFFDHMPTCDQATHPVAPQSLASAGEDHCHGLDQARCDRNPGCYAVRGAKLVATEESFGCFDVTSSYVACRATPAGCGDAITHVCHASGDVYRLADTCGPTQAGFHDCGAVENAIRQLPSCTDQVAAPVQAPPDYHARVRARCAAGCDAKTPAPSPSVHDDPREACILTCIRDLFDG